MSSRWLPRIDRGALGGGGGGQTQDHQAPRVIVGNAPAGDTAFVCDILDPGDGSGIASALAAAVSPTDIWIRSGTYDLGAGAVVGPLVVPTNVTVRGAGAEATIIRGRADQRQVFDVGTNCFFESMTISMPVPNGAPAGTEVIIIRDGTLIDSVLIRFDEYTAPDLANESLRNGFNFRGFAIGTKLLVDGGPRRLDEDTVNARFICFSQEGSPPDPTLAVTLSSVFALQGDVGFLFTANARISDYNAVAQSEFGVYFRSARKSEAINGEIKMAPPQGVASAAVRITAEDSEDSTAVAVVGNDLGTFSSGVGDGVRIETLSGAQDYHGVDHNFVENFDRGIVIADASITKTVVTANRLKGNTTPIVNSGVLTEIAHNVA